MLHCTLPVATSYAKMRLAQPACIAMSKHTGLQRALIKAAETVSVRYPVLLAYRTGVADAVS